MTSTTCIYLGQAPWHGLGVQLPLNASYEEVVEAAGFFAVEEKPLHLPGYDEPSRTQRPSCA